MSSHDFTSFPESVLDPVPIHLEIESPIIHDDHIELDQFHSFENSIDKLASSHFCGIELHEEYDLEPQLRDSILFPDSIMTPVSLPDFNPFPESTLDLFPIHNELNHPSLRIILNLPNSLLLKVPLTNWQVSHVLNYIWNVT